MCGLSFILVALPLSTVQNLTEHLTSMESSNDSALKKVCMHSIKLYIFQWNVLYKGHLSNEDTVCSPKHIELCTNLPLNRDTSHYRTASQLSPNGVLYREVPNFSFTSVVLPCYAYRALVEPGLFTVSIETRN